MTLNHVISRFLITKRAVSDRSANGFYQWAGKYVRQKAVAAPVHSNFACGRPGRGPGRAKDGGGGVRGGGKAGRENAGGAALHFEFWGGQPRQGPGRVKDSG